MNNNDPGGLSPQQMRTLGIMGGACLIVCVSVFCLKGLMHDE